MGEGTLTFPHARPRAREGPPQALIPAELQGAWVQKPRARAPLGSGERTYHPWDWDPGPCRPGRGVSGAECCRRVDSSHPRHVHTGTAPRGRGDLATGESAGCSGGGSGSGEPEGCSLSPGPAVLPEVPPLPQGESTGCLGDSWGRTVGQEAGQEGLWDGTGVLCPPTTLPRAPWCLRRPCPASPLSPLQPPVGLARQPRPWEGAVRELPDVLGGAGQVQMPSPWAGLGGGACT